MLRLLSPLLIAILCLAGIEAMAQSTTNLTDSQIARFLSTAAESNIAAADLALKLSSNSAVRGFASWSLTNHTSMNAKTVALLGTLKTLAEDSEFSQSLAATAAQHRQDLSELSGAAFDTAYVKNELSYDFLVIGALETTLIPSAKDGQLKSALDIGLAGFKENQKNAQRLFKMLKQSGAPHE